MFVRSKIEGTWVGQIVEISPLIRVHIPSFADQDSDPHPVTLFRLYNAKLYEKTSAALIEASIKCLELMSEHTFLLWQPPTYPLVTVIAELLVEWQASKQTVLIITPNTELLHSDLVALGFKAIRLTVKSEDKQLAKNSIVVAEAAPICCDLLRNYAFTRVLVESAQSIS